MKANWKTIGIATVAAAALVYPAILLYRFMRNKMEENSNGEADGEHHVVKAFSPAYRGKHKPHHRHSN